MHYIQECNATCIVPVDQLHHKILGDICRTVMWRRQDWWSHSRQREETWTGWKGEHCVRRFYTHQMV